jgi:formate dehydrogenase subunit delta
VSEDLPAVIRLGADLVRNFEAVAPDDAAEHVAEHIRRFWEPRMRRELLDHVAAGDPRVGPLLARAAEGLREEAVGPEAAAPARG